MKRLPQEFAFVAACCAWPGSAARDETIRAAAGQVDWARVLEVARRHRVEGLVHASLVRSGVEPPGAVSGALEAAARAIARQGLVQAAETARIQQALRARGIESVVLKGVAVDIAAYGRLGLKSAKDIDLLVSPATARAAFAVLLETGYALSHPPTLTEAQLASWIELGRDCELVHATSGLQIELHWRLVDSPFLIPRLDVLAGEDMAVSSGVSVRALRRPKLFAYLCVHGATHGWSRLKWIGDVNALLSGESEAGLQHLYRRSLELGAGLCSAQALALCRRLFGLSLPAPIDAEITGNRVVGWLSAVALDAMAGGGSREIEQRRFGSSWISLSQFLLSGSLRNIPREVAHRWRRGPDLELYISLPAGRRYLYPWARLWRWIQRRIPGLAGRPSSEV